MFLPKVETVFTVDGYAKANLVADSGCNKGQLSLFA